MTQLGCATEKARDDIGKSVSNWALNVKSFGFVTSCFSVSYSVEAITGISKSRHYVAAFI
jgi:hypothetical protein